MFMPACGTQWIVKVGIYLHINSGIRLIKSLRFCDVLERFYGWVEGIQGLVLVGIHHETVVRPSADQRTGNADRRSCPHLEHVPADREDAQDSSCCSSFQNFFLHFRPPTCGTGELSQGHRYSAMEAE